MDSNDILVTISSILPSFLGLYLDVLSRKRNSELIRGIDICSNVVIDEINQYIRKITAHFSKEVNRIMEVAVRQRVTYGDIQSVEVKELELDFKESFALIMETSKHIKHIRRLELAVIRIKVFRWVFCFILAIILIIAGILLLKWQDMVPDWLPTSILIISIIAFILFLFNSAITDSLIDRTEKDHGVSTGK